MEFQKDYAQSVTTEVSRNLAQLSAAQQHEEKEEAGPFLTMYTMTVYAVTETRI